MEEDAVLLAAQHIPIQLKIAVKIDGLFCQIQV